MISLGHAVCNGATPKALRVMLLDGTVHWVPRSVVHDDSEVYDLHHEGNLIVEEWWADKEGLSDSKKRSKT